MYYRNVMCPFLENQPRADESTQLTASATTTTVIGQSNYAIRTIVTFYKDSEGIMYIDTVFDKMNGERFRPYRLSLDSAKNKEISNVTLRSGAMVLTVIRIRYVTFDGKDYYLYLDSENTDSEGEGVYNTGYKVIGKFTN